MSAFVNVSFLMRAFLISKVVLLRFFIFHIILHNHTHGVEFIFQFPVRRRLFYYTFYFPL